MRASIITSRSPWSPRGSCESSKATWIPSPNGGGRTVSAATTQQVLAASRQWLKPLVYVLLRCGVTWREFSELAKTTFVEVATHQFGKRGRPTNVSRTAMLTGLARREVRKQRETLEQAPQSLRGFVSKAALVLSAWHLDPEFLDGKGK